MKKLFALISALVLLLVVSACTNYIQQDADLGQVEGSLSYRERVALPDNARITVTLSDVSKMDVPAEVISSQAFMADGEQVPFNFSLSYGKNKIKPNHTYAVSARIEVDNQLMFITDTANHVITDPAATTQLNLMLVSVK